MEFKNLIGVDFTFRSNVIAWRYRRSAISVQERTIHVSLSRTGHVVVETQHAASLRRRQFVFLL